MDQLEFQLDVNFVSHVGIYVAYDLAQSAQLPPRKNRRGLDMAIEAGTLFDCAI